ncbi:MAG TPA: peptidoglycan DD-metalloendopeptidase family protein [Candidatus Paceibacterota bacterium]|nr:peptidoglycan DD-metalloendopeptidase family protein [Candidatus Paceibacterota bacterium]
MIFPTLKNKAFGYVNLNTEAELWLKDQKPALKENALLDPEVNTKMVADVHKKYGIDFSYGGWMEDRSFLGRGTYLEPLNTYLHLGVDINAPVGTEIAADFNAEVILIDDDYPEEGGWGPRVMLKHQSKPVYFIYGHLDKEISFTKGEKITKGQVFARIGKAPYNGNWFPHVHVQVIREDFYKQLEKENAVEDLDGYGSWENLANHAFRFPDPLQYISLT